MIVAIAGEWAPWGCPCSTPASPLMAAARSNGMPAARPGPNEGRCMPDVTISLNGHDEELAVFGSRDQYLRQVRDALGVKVLARHGEVRVEGDPDRVEQARQVFEELRGRYRRQRSVS